MPDFAQFDDVQDHRAAERFAQANTGGVSTLTHSTAFVARHFLQWREDQKTRETVKRISKERSPKSNGGLRGAAFDMFARGLTVKEVSTELEITYANAHYYSRAFKKSC
jgi:hypothetical protein